MGRALFSLAYAAPEPAVRTEPEPDVEPYGRWSTWNRFDPDSDEFFQDAEYEAFIDPLHIQHQRALSTLGPATDGERTPESSDSGDPSDSDQNSPVIPGSEVPVVLGGRLYNNQPLTRTFTSPTRMAWTERSSSPASYASSPTSLLPVHSPVSPHSPDLSDNPPFIPPPSFRRPTPDIERESSLRIDSPPSPPLRRIVHMSPPSVSRIQVMPAPRSPSPPLRRMVNITPINVSRIQIMPATRSPSPDSPPVPATPPSRPTPLTLSESQAMLTPSPPPSVTPRFYSWQNHPIPALPTSPTVIRGNVHPTFARREPISARVHVPSALF